MKDAAVLTGVVLKAQPYAEYDKRLSILTRERGRITAFVRGARRQSSPMLAATDPFVFGTFTLYEGRDAYNLIQVKATEYFRKLTALQPGVYYGFYFLELLSTVTRENLEAYSLVDLLYVALRAIEREQMDLNLIRLVFECRLMAENGTFAPPEEAGDLDPDAVYAMRFSCTAPIGRLFSFSLSEEAEKDFRSHIEHHLFRTVGAPLQSRRLIDELF